MGAFGWLCTGMRIAHMGRELVFHEEATAEFAGHVFAQKLGVLMLFVQMFLDIFDGQGDL